MNTDRTISPFLSICRYRNRRKKRIIAESFSHIYSSTPFYIVCVFLPRTVKPKPKRRSYQSAKQISIQFLKRITSEPHTWSVELIVILYVFSAIFNRVATGFILCFSEHFRVRRGLGWSLNKLKTSDFRHKRNRRFWVFVVTKTLLASFLQPFIRIS